MKIIVSNSKHVGHLMKLSCRLNLALRKLATSDMTNTPSLRCDYWSRPVLHRCGERALKNMRSAIFLAIVMLSVAHPHVWLNPFKPVSLVRQLRSECRKTGRRSPPHQLNTHHLANELSLAFTHTHTHRTRWSYYWLIISLVLSVLALDKLHIRPPLLSLSLLLHICTDIHFNLQSACIQTYCCRVRSPE